MSLNGERPGVGHRETGILCALKRPWVYNLFQHLITRNNTLENYVKNYIQPSAGQHILDIGCGTASILSYFPSSIASYTGFDMNPDYIDEAKRRWKKLSNASFDCQKVSEHTLKNSAEFDTVIATGILHHLNEVEARQLVKLAYSALKPGGKLITYDNVYIEGQNPIAKWLISKDRGVCVRSPEAYASLTQGYFKSVQSDLLHNTLRVPYTIFIMACIKDNSTF
ncbi:class I SAM-dependent methyltransferase [Endozoicomonadaceae bacterium StTr2]